MKPYSAGIPACRQAGVDSPDLKSGDSNVVRVRVPPAAQ